MTFPRILVLLTILLFGGIAFVGLMKGKNDQTFDAENVIAMAPIEIELDDEIAEMEPEPVVLPVVEEEVVEVDIPEEDRIEEFFKKRGSKLPIIQTVTYKSRVPWMKGRPAWLSDYASHFKTSRHFIARSLNGKLDYFKQDVSEGDRFNVFNEDKNFEFYILVDLKSCKMCFYYYDLDTNERVLLKTYDVGVGRADNDMESGYLTPLGKYTLGEKIAVYRPKTMAFHQGERIEMIRVFGTRWIPFGDEIEGCTDSAKGYGIHGLPWKPDGSNKLAEDSAGLVNYQSDGCIRLSTRDVEELFAIIITRPTTIEIVNGFHKAKMPGEERGL